MVGRTVSHFKILQKLGEGGMGEVYLAEDTSLNRKVALKFLPQRLSLDKQLRARFIHEARVASSIDHSNIGAVYEISESESGDLFIAMAYYEGRTLRQLMDLGPLTSSQIIDYIRQIASGLAKAHERGIIHRDLKPANIIVTSDGIVKIIDFGLAKLFGGISQLTRAGASIGTTSYMSPEQVRGEELDNRSDLWSLGVILYEMITGSLPFPGEYDAAVFYKILNEPPGKLIPHDSNTPPSLIEIVDRCLQKDLSLRFTSSDEVVLLLDLPGPGDSRGPKKSDANALATFSRRHWIKMLAAIVGLVTIILILGIRKFGHRSIILAPSSFAILPIENLAAAESEYFTDGITRDLIAGVATLPGISVVSKTTLFAYKRTELPIREITDNLGIQYIIRGKMKLGRSSMTLDLEIVDTKSEAVIWDNSFSSARSQLLEFEQKVIAEVGRAITGNESTYPHLLSPSTVELREIYWKGEYHLNEYKNADAKLAIEYFNELIRKDSVFLRAHVDMSEALMLQFESGWDVSPHVLSLAEEHCKFALRHDTDMVQALVVLGRIERAKGASDQAARFWESAIAKDPKNSTALIELSRFYLFDKNEPARAVTYLRRLQETDPTDWLINSNLGVGYAQLKEYSKAQDWFRHSLKLYSRNAPSWVNLGYVYERSGQYDSSLACYQKALEYDTKHPVANENYLTLLIAVGRYTTAETVAVSALREMPHSFELQYFLGVTYALRDLGKQARITFEEGLKLAELKLAKNPAFPVAHGYAALFHARLGNSQKAVLHATKAASLNPDDNEIIMILARIYSVLGMKKEMLHYYRRAKQMNPEYDLSYLTSAPDFEKTREDPDLQFIARLE